MHYGENSAKLKTKLTLSPPFEMKMLVELIRHGIPVP